MSPDKDFVIILGFYLNIKHFDIIIVSNEDGRVGSKWAALMTVAYFIETGKESRLYEVWNMCVWLCVHRERNILNMGNANYIL